MFFGSCYSLDSHLHSKMSAGKLFQITAEVYKNECLAESVINLGTSL